MEVLQDEDSWRPLGLHMHTSLCACVYIHRNTHVHGKKCSFWPHLCPKEDDLGGGDGLGGLLPQNFHGAILRPQAGSARIYPTPPALDSLSSFFSPFSLRQNMIALHRRLINPHEKVLGTDLFSPVPDLNLKKIMARATRAGVFEN